MPTPSIDLTILLPCLDEEKSIAQCVKEALGFLERNAIQGEVLVVDNDSRDQTAAVAEESGARVVRERNKGYGNAINAGIKAACGKFIILGDGDGEYDMGLLEPFWERLQSGYDLVVGNRYWGRKTRGSSSFLRRYIGGPLLSKIGKLLFRPPVNDFHSPVRGFNVESVHALSLQATGMEWASEVIIKAKLKGMRMTEVPITLRPCLDPARKSKLRTWFDGWRHLHLLITMRCRAEWGERFACTLRAGRINRKV